MKIASRLLKLIVNCQLSIVFLVTLLLLTTHYLLLTNESRAQSGCTFSVSPVEIAPHGSFTVTVQNLTISTEYIIIYDSSNFATIWTAISNTFTTTVSVDTIFGASSPQAANGTFLINVGTTHALGHPGAEICSPTEGIPVTVNPNLQPPPSPTPPPPPPSPTPTPTPTPPPPPPSPTPTPTPSPSPQPSGNIDANPETCQVQVGQTACQSTITWTTSNVANPSICIADVAVGNNVPLVTLTGTSGTRTMSFNSGITYRISLFANSPCNTLLDSTTVTALAPPSPIPTPLETPPTSPPVEPSSAPTPPQNLGPVTFRVIPPELGGCFDNATSFSIINCFHPAKMLAGLGHPGTTGIGKLASDILLILVSIAASLSVIFIVIAGIKFVTSGGDSKKLASASGTLTYAIIGIVVTVLAFIILRIVQFFLQSNVPIT